MHISSIALALLLSAVAGAVVAATAMPPAAMFDDDAVSMVGYKQKPADCHRSVRTHRIFGVLIRHRHVGDDCRVREVKQLKAK